MKINFTHRYANVDFFKVTIIGVISVIILLFNPSLALGLSWYGKIVDNRTRSPIKEAVIAANNAAKSQDIVLLSPACSSLDMFENYEHRGNEFIKAVENIRSEN